VTAETYNSVSLNFEQSTSVINNTDSLSNYTQLFLLVQCPIQKTRLRRTVYRIVQLTTRTKTVLYRSLQISVKTTNAQ